jgi:hypothetical protein
MKFPDKGHNKDEKSTKSCINKEGVKYADISQWMNPINQKCFWYEIQTGNNPKLIKSVIARTFRNSYWRDFNNPDELNS